jgi:hypothetical protein
VWSHTLPTDGHSDIFNFSKMVFHSVETHNW